MKQSIAAMVASPSGGKGCSVIVISSQLGLEGSPGYSAYAASKFAVRGLMSAAAQEYGPLGIRVNAICPGPIQTPLMADYTEEEMGPHIAKTSLGRVGQPEEIAATAVFLASEGGAYMSGASLKVDGGWSQWC
ncbi:hypothetical protein VHUM_02054 [Vanrija humicola]|uniref:Uncharacterized protein n=1 Tax=Vanrija humicola TaxID=5417 RepID=A0A7D8V0V8_VANHU|nr:hypothetical protein VHUM_02054 [Vanrija humicola]